MADGLAPQPWGPDPNRTLAGAATALNTVTPATIITIPAGRSWHGKVSAQANSTSGTAGGVDGAARVVTAGTGVLPAAGTILAQSISRRDTGAATDRTEAVKVVAPAGNDVTLQLVLTTAATFAGGAHAYGELSA